MCSWFRNDIHIYTRQLCSGFKAVTKSLRAAEFVIYRYFGIYIPSRSKLFSANTRSRTSVLLTPLSYDASMKAEKSGSEAW